MTTSVIIKSYVPDGHMRTLTIPQGVIALTTIVWGGAGGGGGNDRYGGGTGAPGSLVEVTFNVSAGDIVKLGVGAGGAGGSQGSNAPGGAGGAGANLGGNISFGEGLYGPISYVGGTGGRSGPSGGSGAGGGGGAASVVILNGNVIAVAGGGGGGGGGGNYGSGAPASIVSASATGPTGQNGQDHGGDGGGGGGGGGGYNGGLGGAIPGGDVGGNAGQHGSSWFDPTKVISGTITHGTGLKPPLSIIGQYDIGAYANGGAATTAGGGGYAVVQFGYLPYPRVKVGGTWKSVSNVFVKINSVSTLSGLVWAPVSQIALKNSGKWKYVTQLDPTTEFVDIGTQWSAGGTRLY
jgi:hypothetical protein